MPVAHAPDAGRTFTHILPAGRLATLRTAAKGPSRAAATAVPCQAKVQQKGKAAAGPRPRELLVEFLGTHDFAFLSASVWTQF